MYNARHTGQPNTPRPPGQAQFNGPMNVVNESCDRIRKEFEALQSANHNLRMELDKVHAEKSENHKHLIMYYEMSYGLHMDIVRQKEIVKRLHGLVLNIMPMLSSDQQAHIATALDRAKQLSPEELNNILRDQSGEPPGYGAPDLHPSMANIPGLGRGLPGTPGLPLLPNLPPHGPPLNLPHNMPPHSMSHGPPMHGLPPQSMMQPGLNLSSPPNTAGLLSMSGPPNMPGMGPGGLLQSLPGGPPPPHPGPMPKREDNSSMGRAASRSSATSATSDRDHHQNSDVKPHINSNKKQRRNEEIHINSNSSSLSDDDRSEDLVVDGNDDRVDRNTLPKDIVLVHPSGDSHLGPNGSLLPYGVIQEPFTMIKDSEGRFKSIPASPRALNDPEIPKGASERVVLMHGEVVCAVALSNPTRNIYTGGKGFVKIWSLDNPDSNNGHCSPSVVHDPIAQIPCLAPESYVRSCKLLGGGKKLVVGGETPPITVWDLGNGGPKQIGHLQELATACYALAISPDSKICISCFSDGTVGLYDIHNLQLISSFTGHVDGASCADISSDGNSFFTGGLDFYLKSWNLHNNMIGESDYLTKTKFPSQIFSLGCCPKGDYTAVGMEDSIVEVMNIHKKQEKMQLKMHDTCVLALKFAASGKWFLTTGKDKLINICGSPELNCPLLMKFLETGSVLSCDISEDDRFFATGSGEKKATVYEVTY